MKRKDAFRRMILIIMAALPAVSSLCACTLIPPTPDNEQIVQAVMTSNDNEDDSLELVYEEMEVPHRLPGKASAVIWVSDKSIQRNFTIAYDKKEKTFYVESYITLVLGEDGVYRKGQE